MPGQVPRKVMQQRSQELHDLGIGMKQDTLQQNLGHSYQVLIECLEQDPDPDQERLVWSGYTPNYLRIALPYTAGEELNNQIVTAQLEAISVDNATLLGTIIEE